MTLPQFVGTALNADANLLALVPSAQIFHGLRPQADATLPAINYFEVGEFASDGVASTSEVQVSGHAATALAAHQVGDAIKRALVGLDPLATSLAVGFDVQKIEFGSASLQEEPDAGTFTVPVTLQFITAAILV